MITRTEVPPFNRSAFQARAKEPSVTPHKLHRLLLLPFIALIVICLTFGFHVSAESAPILSVMVVLFFGMPHGAFDVALVARSWPHPTWGRKAKFIAEYVAIAGIVMLFWFKFPGEALCAFLGLSVLHFSEDWEEELAYLSRIIAAASIICFPALYHQDGVAAIFAWLVPLEDAAFLAKGMHIAAFGLIPATTIVVASLISDRGSAALEITAVLTLAAIATPLTFFVIYFCGLHSIRHLGHVCVALHGTSMRSLLLLGVPYAAAAITGVIALSFSFALPLEGGLIRSLFLGLAALTVPHMLLVNEE